MNWLEGWKLLSLSLSPTAYDGRSLSSLPSLTSKKEQGERFAVAGWMKGWKLLSLYSFVPLPHGGPFSRFLTPLFYEQTHQ
jgi:hypothetical protein